MVFSEICRLHLDRFIQNSMTYNQVVSLPPPFTKISNSAKFASLFLGLSNNLSEPQRKLLSKYNSHFTAQQNLDLSEAKCGRS